MNKQEKKQLKKRLQQERELLQRDLDEEKDDDEEVKVPLKKKPLLSNNDEEIDGGNPEEDEDEEDEDDNMFRPDKTKKSKVIDVEFELVLPSEAYYHSVRALLNQYLDGEENEQLDVSGLADQVVNTISIGSVVASSLD